MKDIQLDCYNFTCYYFLFFFVFQDDEIKSKSLPERFGYALKHAGVAITITSVTDLLAFGIGKDIELSADS